MSRRRYGLSVDPVSQLGNCCRLANAISRCYNEGERGTCVLTAHALAGFLTQSTDFVAEPVRVEVHIHHSERAVTGSTLGWDGDGSRTPAARPGCWHGHLAVWCQGYVLDPTIDQCEVGGLRIEPATFLAPEGCAESNGTGCGDGIVQQWTEGPLTVAYGKCHRQVGWKSAGDARRSHWQPITDAMVDYLAFEGLALP